MHCFNRYVMTLPNSFRAWKSGSFITDFATSMCRNFGNTPDSQNWWRWRPTGSIRRLHMALLQGFRWMQRVYTPVDLGSQSEVVERWPITLLLTQLLSNGSQVWCSQLCLRRPLCLVMGGCNCGCAHAACAGWGGWPGGVCLRWMSAGVFSAAQPVVCF